MNKNSTVQSSTATNNQISDQPKVRVAVSWSSPNRKGVFQSATPRERKCEHRSSSLTCVGRNFKTISPFGENQNFLLRELASTKYQNTNQNRVNMRLSATPFLLCTQTRLLCLLQELRNTSLAHHGDRRSVTSAVEDGSLSCG
jgi:hypothetical protein